MHKQPSTMLRLHVPCCPRLLVECRYLPGSVVSVGYLVKSPSLGPSIKAQGVFGVQLRIAKGLKHFLLLIKPSWVLSYSLLKNINHFFSEMLTCSRRFGNQNFYIYIYIRFCTLTTASFHSDEHHNDYYPQYHQPLHMLLGKPLYLEVRLLNPPDPTAMLLVHYCVAYPRSAKSAWILIYDGYEKVLFLYTFT